MPTTPRGVRSVSERIVKNGRALIVTSEDDNNFDTYFQSLPNGSLHVDTQTGVISVKLEGDTSWTPATTLIDGANKKNDASIQNPDFIIARDTQFNEETFTIIRVDKTAEVFEYDNAQGQKKQKPCLYDGTYFVFELEEGEYLRGRNHLDVSIDGVLHRTAMNKEIEEISEKRFAVLEELQEGQTITVRYVKWARIGNPYPRWFLGPTPDDAHPGDFWLDHKGDMYAGTTLEGLSLDRTKTVEWNQIVGRPETLGDFLKMFGADDPLPQCAKVNHVHHYSEIIDHPAIPTKLPANGGNSFTVLGYAVSSPGGVYNPKTGSNINDGYDESIMSANDIENFSAKQKILLLDNEGKIDSRCLKGDLFNSLGLVKMGTSEPEAPPTDGYFWFNPNTKVLKIRYGGEWVAIGGVWA